MAGAPIELKGDEPSVTRATLTNRTHSASERYRTRAVSTRLDGFTRRQASSLTGTFEDRKAATDKVAVVLQGRKLY